MESRKIVLMNLFAGQQWRCRHREKTCGHSRGRKGWDKLRESMETYNVKTDSQWKFAVRCREFKLGTL